MVVMKSQTGGTGLMELWRWVNDVDTWMDGNREPSKERQLFAAAALIFLAASKWPSETTQQNGLNLVKILIRGMTA